MPDCDFSVNYTGGEYQRGVMGTELLGIGGRITRSGDGDEGNRMGAVMVVNQTIGAEEEGYWEGDGTSSGLMGPTFPSLPSQQTKRGRGGYSSILFTL